MVHLAWAVKDAQVEKKHCYHCSSPEHFLHDCLLVRASRENTQLNHKRGWHQRRDPRPSDKNGNAQEPPEGGPQGIKQLTQTPS